MVVSIEPGNGYSNTGPSIADYTSMVLQMYLETLEQSSMAQLLDVGTVNQENIMYFRAAGEAGFMSVICFCD